MIRIRLREREIIPFTWTRLCDALNRDVPYDGSVEASDFQVVLVKILDGGFGQAGKPHQPVARKFSRRAAETQFSRPT